MNFNTLTPDEIETFAEIFQKATGRVLGIPDRDEPASWVFAILDSLGPEIPALPDLGDPILVGVMTDENDQPGLSI